MDDEEAKRIEENRKAQVNKESLIYCYHVRKWMAGSSRGTQEAD